jgi:hypothetical protein
MDKTLPSPPSLSSTLLTQFNTLSGGAGVRIFRTMYLHLWRYLWPVSRFDDVALAYTLPRVLGSLDPLLTLHQWFTLSKLHTLSRGGVDAVNTRSYPFTKVEGHHIARLIEHNMIRRTSFDPAHPHLVRPKHIQRTYISFTPSGLNYFRGVLREMYRTSHNDIYLLTIGSNKKPRADRPPGE